MQRTRDVSALLTAGRSAVRSTAAAVTGAGGFCYGAVMFGWYRTWRRRRLARRPLPPAWPAILERRVPFWRRLPEAERRAFLEKLKVFVWEKHFIPAGGMALTDEVRVVIAAAAVRLVLHLDLSFYDRLTEIVVYPGAYRHPDRGGAILGEAHHWGTVVLSWSDVTAGLANRGDGHDTATHEFAHVLDRNDGAFDGTPELPSRADYAPWTAVLGRHFAGLREADEDERRVLREYGATNEAEFFAVATESFFEKPVQMRARLPALYERLRGFYGCDPAAGFAAADGAERKPPGRNDPCPCGSGRKFKKCCGRA